METHVYLNHSCIISAYVDVNTRPFSGVDNVNEKLQRKVQRYPYYTVSFKRFGAYLNLKFDPPRSFKH